MSILFLDLETYCEIPIKNGAHAYAEEAEITVFAFAFDNDKVEVIDIAHDLDGQRQMENVLSFIPGVDKVIAHNSHFDRTVLRHCGYDIPIEYWHDTMARALAHGLPGSLGTLSDIFKLGDKAKDKEGKALLQLFCKPRPKKQKIRRATRETHPAEWKKFLDYARLDIEAMRALYSLLPEWNYCGDEFRLWQLDQRINDRGIAMDVELAHAAISAVKAAQGRLAEKTSDLTFGYVESATQRNKLLKFINDYWDMNLADLKADTIERLLDGAAEVPWDLRELLQTRLQASTTSTTKYNRVLSGVSSDGRLRGLLKFCGAARTGRWSGQLFQPQNLMRPTLKNPAIEQGIAAMKAGVADLMYSNVMEIAANAMRGVMVASPDKKLVVADLANIEGRAAAWLASEDWKLDAFRAYDAKEGEDLYKIAYGRMFNIDPADVGDDDPRRQIGKVAELMLQYEGGVGAYLTGAVTYSIDLEDMANGAIKLLPADALKAARKAYQWAQKKDRTFGLAEDTYVVCDAFKRMWRDAHPAITETWAALDAAIRRVIESPTQKVKVGSLTVVKDKNWLKVVLPSGRALSYAAPRIERGKISYMGVHIYTKQWRRIYTYGGKIFENVCQAVARDIMAAHMPAIEDFGYEILLSVHDELITEIIDAPYRTVNDLVNLMVAPIDWAPGIPLAAKGFETYRYRKG